MTEKRTVNKKVILIICIIIAIVVAAVLVVSYNPLKVKSDTFNVEYGEIISTDASTYLKDDVDPAVVKGTEVTHNGNKEDGKEYDKVGEYPVTLTYENKTSEVVVIVSDNTKPVFNEVNEIDSITGVELNFAELITATDLAGCEVTFNTEDFNKDKAGTYTVKAIAEDTNGNKAKKDIKITVAEAPVAASADVDVSVDKETGKVVVRQKTTSKSSTSSSSSSSYYDKKSNTLYVEDKEHGDIGDGRTWDSSDWVPLPEGW